MKIPYTRTSISGFLSYQAVPNTSQLLNICNILDITIYQLIGIENPYKLTNEELLILNELKKIVIRRKLLKEY